MSPCTGEHIPLRGVIEGWRRKYLNLEPVAVRCPKHLLYVGVGRGMWSCLAQDARHCWVLSCRKWIRMPVYEGSFGVTRRMSVSLSP